jgi:cytochrome P450
MTLLSLITSPSAYTSLLDEIKQASGKVKSPISWAETQTLPYLQAVVLEGLRIWPPVAGLGFKTVPPAGDNINGFFVPGGTDIGQGFHGVGRSRAVWGPDADVFRPERWLLANEAELQKMTAAVDTHFGGSGKFSCLGKNVALMEIHKSLFEVRF